MHVRIVVPTRGAGRSRFTAASLAALVSLLAACGGGGEQAQTGAGETGSAQAGANAGAQTAAANGQELYQRCVTCHQANGEGLAGTYPPLAGSEWVNGNPAVPIRIVLKGMQGPITVKGTEYNSAMPAYGTGIEMSDEEVAAVLTYVRSQWGNTGSPITAQQVAAERSATASQQGAMTAADVEALLKQ